jgi:hypothetical protein
MRYPRATGTGPATTDARNSRAGDEIVSTKTGPKTRSCYGIAPRPDRDAHALPFECYHLNDESLNRLDLELREMPA